jgi:hypothetical protein
MNPNKVIEEISKELLKYRWDFFITLTFKRKISDREILKLMNRFTNHYLIEGWVWCREFTTLGYPHLHIILSTRNTHQVNKLHTLLLQWGDVHLTPFNPQRGGISYTLKTYNTPNLLWDMKQPSLPIYSKLRKKYYEGIRK